MTVSTASAEVFACYTKACAPPPAGHGGSGGKPTSVNPRYGDKYTDSEHGPVKIISPVSKHDGTVLIGNDMTMKSWRVKADDLVSRGYKAPAPPKQKEYRGTDDPHDRVADRPGYGRRKYTDGSVARRRG